MGVGQGKRYHLPPFGWQKTGNQGEIGVKQSQGGEDRRLGEALAWLDPAGMSYGEWVKVGMALKQAGRPLAEWEAWSRRDPARFRPGECARKWAGFHGAGCPVTGGTVLHLARQAGWPGGVKQKDSTSFDRTGGEQKDSTSFDRGSGEYKNSTSFDRESTEQKSSTSFDQEEKGKKDSTFFDRGPGELGACLAALFAPEERVGYVVESYPRGARFAPGRGVYRRTAGELAAALAQAGSVEAALGTITPGAGAWLRVNPLDGAGVRDENVTAWRHALVECDTLPLKSQYRLLRALNLPLACLVYSGGKSLHAVVKVQARDPEEYRERVGRLYAACEAAGLPVDRSNSNPSRLFRMPGVGRGEGWQRLLGVNLGPPSWEAWLAGRESRPAEGERPSPVHPAADGLPQAVELAAVWRSPPPLSAPLIGGVLRRGHKLMLAGPSKAGKSFALMQLCRAIERGEDWLGFPCARGRVLYVNLELDGASCIHRFRRVYAALGGGEPGRGLLVWNLRGAAPPMEELARAAVARWAGAGLDAVVLDPVYKAAGGGENSAGEAARFCAGLDRLCAGLGCAVICCHHHSKGGQGGKRAADRASGSGVFARDMDALLDLIPLDAPPGPAGETPWRLEGTLREFAPFPPVDLWFACPVHRRDDTGALAGARPWEEREPAAPPAPSTRREGEQARLLAAFRALAGETGESAAVGDLAQRLGVSPQTVKNRVDRCPALTRDSRGRVHIKTEGWGQKPP